MTSRSSEQRTKHAPQFNREKTCVTPEQCYLKAVNSVEESRQAQNRHWFGKTKTSTQTKRTSMRRHRFDFLEAIGDCIVQPTRTTSGSLIFVVTPLVRRRRCFRTLPHLERSSSGVPVSTQSTATPAPPPKVNVVDACIQTRLSYLKTNSRKPSEK